MCNAVLLTNHIIFVQLAIKMPLYINHRACFYTTSDTVGDHVPEVYDWIQIIFSYHMLPWIVSTKNICNLSEISAWCLEMHTYISRGKLILCNKADLYWIYIQVWLLKDSLYLIFTRLLHEIFTSIPIVHPCDWCTQRWLFNRAGAGDRVKVCVLSIESLTWDSVSHEASIFTEDINVTPVTWHVPPCWSTHATLHTIWTCCHSPW